MDHPLSWSAGTIPTITLRSFKRIHLGILRSQFFRIFFIFFFFFKVSFFILLGNGKRKKKKKIQKIQKR